MAAEEPAMPLRDHFRPPVSKRHSWEGFHGMWPMAIVQQLREQLPAGYTAAPLVRLGSNFDEPLIVGAFPPTRDDIAPVVALEVEHEVDYEYEVRIYDTAPEHEEAERERTLVAAIEIVSPANKDRPRSRNAFVAKCAELVRRGVAVSIVDPVTIQHFNLYAELMAFTGYAGADPMCANPPPISAASVRRGPRGEKVLFEAWSRALAVGEPLPLLPLWLSQEVSVALDLERSYESACHSLWIA
jgi:hypothetical protein